jgi:DNA gyrase subunit A
MSDETEIDEMDDNGHDELQMLEWSGERIDFAEALRDRGIIYARKTITDRALPDVRDGLKPVQRRIVYAMFEMNLHPNAKPKKSSKIVGDTMGAYHPHGDTSIYGAMARLAQSFQMTLPLVRGYGQWGNPDANPAAPRYTEATLSHAGWSVAQDLNSQIVRFVPTYDEENEEPSVLPLPFPNLIVNGTSGMAYGMACEYPPHNLSEAIDAALLVADDENVSLKKLMRKLPGPDFPGGGIIVNPENLPDIYETGNGTIKLQAKFYVDNPGSSHPKIVITELPYQSGFKKLVAQIKAANAKSGAFEDLAFDGLDNFSDDANGMHIEIKCKRGGDVNQLLQDLMKLSTFQRTISFNFNAIVEHEGIIRPQHLNLVGLLREFVQFRREVVTKRLELERAKLLKRIHELNGVIAALDVIDEVIRIIRGSKNTEAAKTALMKAVKYRPEGERKARYIDELQAQYILALRLARLTQLDQFELREERDQKRARVAEIDVILASAELLNELIKSELKELRDQFAAPRRTLLQSIDTTASLEEIAAASQRPAEEVTAFVTRSGKVLLQPVKGRRQSQSAPIKVASGDEIVAALDTLSDADLIAITEQGDAHLVMLSDSEPVSRGSGDDLIRIRASDRVAGIYQETEGVDYLVMVTRLGKLKRIHRETLSQVNPDGVPAYRVDDGDEIVAVVPHGEGADLMIATAQGQLLRTPLDKLRPTKGGAAGGRDAIKLREGDHVIGALAAVAGSDILTVHEAGHGKRVAEREYPVKGIATGGVASASPDKPTRHPAGPVAYVAAVSSAKKLTVRAVTAKGKIVEFAVDEAVARAVVSRPLAGVEGSDRVVAQLG